MNKIPEKFIVGKNLDTAWSNFDPSIVLPAGCPFYVEWPDKTLNKPLNKLIRALVREHRRPPKYFFSGHRGCGKSTEVNKLAVDKEIKKEFFVVKYSVKDVCDVNNLNYVDVLLSIAAQIYLQYTGAGKEIDKNLMEDLKKWGSTIIIEKEKEISMERSIGGDIHAFFISVMGKIQREDMSRETIRKAIEPKLSDLIDKINNIIAYIEGEEKKKVLVVIDDMDKPGLEQAKKIFFTNYTAITQPSCYIVYTVPISLFFDDGFVALKDSRFFLPNIKLHPKNNRNEMYVPGYEIMKEFVFKRMDKNLIELEALDLVIKMSGGVFRECARTMQIAADNAIEKERDHIIKEDVERARLEMIGDFKRFIKSEDYTLLNEIYKNNDTREIDKIGHLLHNLSVLEYTNDDTWYDINPVLEELVKNKM